MDCIGFSKRNFYLKIAIVIPIIKSFEEKFGLISMLLYGNTLWIKGEIGRNLFLQRLIDNCERILQFNRITMIIVKNFRKKN